MQYLKQFPTSGMGSMDGQGKSRALFGLLTSTLEVCRLNAVLGGFSVGAWLLGVLSLCSFFPSKIQKKVDLDVFYKDLHSYGSVEETSPAIVESFWQVHPHAPASNVSCA